MSGRYFCHTCKCEPTLTFHENCSNCGSVPEFVESQTWSERAEKAEAERDVMTKRVMDISQEFVVISEHNIALKNRLDRAEAENAQLKAWLDEATDFYSWEMGHYEALEQYEEWRNRSKNNPSASTQSPTDDTTKLD